MVIIVLEKLDQLSIVSFRFDYRESPWPSLTMSAP